LVFDFFGGVLALAGDIALPGEAGLFLFAVFVIERNRTN